MASTGANDLSRCMVPGPITGGPTCELFISSWKTAGKVAVTRAVDTLDTSFAFHAIDTDYHLPPTRLPLSVL